MEIDRDVILEYGGDNESGASAGSRSATLIPRFTSKEVAAELGPQKNEEPARIFDNVKVTEASEPATAAPADPR